MDKFLDGNTFEQKVALKLITTSPNTVAKMVEDTLGIRFSDSPIRINLNLPNRLLIAFFFPHPYLADSKRDLLRGRLGIGGMYFPEDNIYFANPNDFRSEAAEIHENMHAFTYQTNPGLRQSGQDFIELLDAPQATGNHSSLTILDRYITQCIFDEGVAEWGKSEVIDRFYRSSGKNPDIQRRARFAEQTLITPYRLGIYRSYIPRLEQFAVRSFRLYQQALSESDERKKEGLLKEAHKSLRALSYSDTTIDWGPNFVDIVMDYLIGSGLEISEALPLLVKNPPSRLTQLFDPMKYISSISNS